MADTYMYVKERRLVWTSEFENKSALFQEIRLRQFPIVLFCICYVLFFSRLFLFSLHERGTR